MTAVVSAVLSAGSWASQAAGPVLIIRGDGGVEAAWAPPKDESAVMSLKPGSGEAGQSLIEGYTGGKGIWRFHLEGLEKGREYSYSIGSESGRTGVFGFRTAGNGGLLAAVAGRTRGSPAELLSLSGAILARKPSLLIFADGLSDWADAGADRETELFDAAGDLMASTPVFMPSCDRFSTDSAIAGLYYHAEAGYVLSAVAGGVLFIAVRPEWPDSENEKHLTAIRNLISKSAERLRIAVVPKPFLNSGASGCDREGRRRVMPVLLEGGVVLVISSGPASYERSLPAGLAENARSIVQVVTGGAGAPPEKLRPLPWTACHAACRHFVILESRDNILTVTAVDGEGVIIDRFEFGETGLKGKDASRRFVLLSAELDVQERQTMRDLAGSFRELKSALSSDEKLGVAHLASRFEALASKVAGIRILKELETPAHEFQSEASAAADLDLSMPESRIIAETRLEHAGMLCRRCHGLFR